MILARESAHKIRAHADSLGLKTLLDDGMDKVEKGITTFDEVMRVTAMG
jgi:type II secretory ATPase GspE/PulE/Tfp pilus assembly ATPase PilB-like protein